MIMMIIILISPFPSHSIFALLTPNSTGITVPLNAAIVSPKRLKILGCHPSANRSSVNIGLRSSTSPPKIVSIVEELYTSQHLFSTQIYVLNVLRTSEPIMEQTLAIRAILRPRIPSALRQRARQILFGQLLPALARRLFQQLFYKLQIRFPLIRLKRHIAPRQARIMFNCIMLAEFREIKGSRPVAAAQEIRGEVRHEKAERGREVEGLAHGGVEVAEGNVLAVVWEDGVVGERVEHGARRARVTGAGGRICGPVACVAGSVGWYDGGGWVWRKDKVEKEDLEVPGEDE
jgi:hypothetical protein